MEAVGCVGQQGCFAGAAGPRCARSPAGLQAERAAGAAGQGGHPAGCSRPQHPPLGLPRLREDLELSWTSAWCISSTGQISATRAGLPFQRPRPEIQPSHLCWFGLGEG